MNKPSVELSKVDSFLLDWFPSYGQKRFQNKLALAGAKAAGYVTPGSTKPSMRGFRATANTVEYDTAYALNPLRAGSRDMWMNTPIAVSVLRRFQTNVVGFGLTVQSRIDHEALSISEEAAAEWQRMVERRWRLWAESKDCDARRVSNFNDLQALAYLSELMNGDCFALLPYIPRPGSLSRIRVLLVEADFVKHPPTEIETFKLSGGVETDDYGAPIAYHIMTIPRNYPVGSTMEYLATFTRVPAFGAKSGRRNVLHMFRVDRVGQRRGIPLLAVVIEKLKQVSRLSEAELTASVVTSLFTVFVKNTPTGGLASGYTPNTEVVSSSDPLKAKLYEMGPGSIVGLDENEDIEIADPKRPNAAFEPFFLAIVKEIGAAVELPYEIILQSFNSSYSASRAALLEALKAFKTHRTRMVSGFCQPVFEAWLDDEVASGRISAPGYFEDPLIRAAWLNTKWNGPGQGMINPESEIKASVTAIENCLSTYEEEYAARTGEDWEPMARTLSRERKLKKTLGLKSAEEMKPSGYGPPASETEEPEKEEKNAEARS